MSKRAAVVVSGCGFLDGSEIHETTLLFLALSQLGIAYHTFAPDRDQSQVIDHKSQKPANENRNMLSEGARIARCDIHDLNDFRGDYDVLCLPGGFGAASNLSNFAAAGTGCTVDPELAKWIVHFHTQEKPIVAICIAPILVAKALEGKGCKITLGTDNKYLDMLKELGHDPVSCRADQACLDEKNQIYTAPGYMEPASLKQMYASITKAVSKL